MRLKMIGRDGVLLTQGGDERKASFLLRCSDRRRVISRRIHMFDRNGVVVWVIRPLVPETVMARVETAIACSSINQEDTLDHGPILPDDEVGRTHRGINGKPACHILS